MYFLHTNRAGSGNIFNGKLYTGAAEGERKGVKVQENSSSVTNLRWFWKRERLFFFFFWAAGKQGSADFYPLIKTAQIYQSHFPAARQGKEKPPVHSKHETALQAGI